MTTPVRPIRIGTRGSALALIQAGLVARAFAADGRPTRIVTLQTEGDRRAPDTAWGEGAFVAAIERALLADRVDVAVHSAKDVPTDEPPGLRIGAYLPRADPRDALVVPVGSAVRSLGDLRTGAVVGTDSPRRAAFLRACRPDLVVRPLHGNVDTRLRRLDEGAADALVLAVAGLVRLGRSDRIAAVLDAVVVPPAPGQGAIAVQIRASDARMIGLTAAIDDRSTRLAVEAERAFLRATGGGCRSPIAALANVDGDRIRLLGAIATEDGGRTAIDTVEAAAGDAVAAAERLASALAAQIGARRDGRPAIDGVTLQEIVAPLDDPLAGDGHASGTAQSSASGGAGPLVVVSRPEEVASAGSDRLGDALASAGLGWVSVPAIAIEPLPPSADLDAGVRLLAGDDSVVVSSPNGVRTLLPHLDRLGIRADALPWAAIGNATAATLRTAGPSRVWQPTRPDSEALGSELPIHPHARVGVVRGRLAGDAVAGRLRARGADVHEVVLYDTVEAPASSRRRLVAALDRRPVAIVIASPSAARGLVTLAGSRRPELLELPAIAIGPRTGDAARAAGFRSVAVAAAPDPAVIARLVADTVGVESNQTPEEIPS